MAAIDRSAAKPAGARARREGGAQAGKPGRGRDGDDRQSCDMVVVSHTHWDREWYWPFQRFRFRLVTFMDALIDELERDESFTHFLLDGQTIVLEDYLAIRPERTENLKVLIGTGRIHVGPWYLLPDEQLVSGESLIRNLMLGHALAEQYGGVMKEGYVPDTFGHIAQLPQLLTGFGIPSFYTMRGLAPDLSQLKSEFEWVAPAGPACCATTC